MFQNLCKPEILKSKLLKSEDAPKTSSNLKDSSLKLQS